MPDIGLKNSLPFGDGHDQLEGELSYGIGAYHNHRADFLNLRPDGRVKVHTPNLPPLGGGSARCGSG